MLRQALPTEQPHVYMLSDEQTQEKEGISTPVLPAGSQGLLSVAFLSLVSMSEPVAKGLEDTDWSGLDHMTTLGMRTVSSTGTIWTKN